MKDASKPTIKGCSVYLRNLVTGIDCKLLVFLLLFLNVKMVIKIIAIIIIYFLRPDFKFEFRLKNSRLPLFYPILLLIGLYNLIISGLFTKLTYDIVFITGVLFWGLSILAIHQVKLSVEKNSLAVTHQTLRLFFIVNAIVSLIMYAAIVWETKSVNPFQFQGEFEKYFISTGDYIKGITFDTSSTNAVISLLGVFYFLYRKDIGCCLLCMIIMLLTGSNITNILFCIVLLYTLIFQSTRDQKSVLVVCGILLIIFMAKISPQNKNYLSETYHNYFEKDTVATQIKKSNDLLIQKDTVTIKQNLQQQIAKTYLDSINAYNSLKEQHKIIGNINPAFVSQITGKPIIPTPNINGPAFQFKRDTTAVQITLLNFIKENKTLLPLSSSDTSLKRPGKIIALQQTVNYFKYYPAKILMGTGIGNFSSKLAFRSTAMDLAGGYPKKIAYINRDFETNHFDLYAYYFSKTDNIHSLANTPNSVYDQLLAEYGLLGIIAFFIFYIGFFMKHYKFLTYGIPLLLIMMGAFFIEYWFEQLSVVIIFELLLLINNKEAKLLATT